jgi:hypothetical protein
MQIDVYIKVVMELSAIKIAWKDWAGPQYIISVDGVHFRIYKPRTNPSTSWMSYKFQSAGLAYEIGLLLTSNDIVWINRPFKASVGDLTIFKDRGLADMIGPIKRPFVYLSAGPGYKEKLAIQNQQDSIEIREFKKRACARHENLNARMKMLRSCRRCFRHDHSKHVASTSSQAINNSLQLLLAQHRNYWVLLGHHSVVADDELLLVVAAVADSGRA